MQFDVRRRKSLDVRQKNLGARDPDGLDNKVANQTGPERRDVRPGRRPRPGRRVDAPGHTARPGPPVGRWRRTRRGTI